MSLSEAERRIDKYWQPYHRMLQTLLDGAHQSHGQAILIDCHSMPHEAVDGIARRGIKRPDVVLGDRFGAAAGGEVVDRVEAAFARLALQWPATRRLPVPTLRRPMVARRANNTLFRSKLTGRSI